MASSSLNHISLPFELTEEILSEIPIEYLIQFHLICKEWYSLLKNKRFIYNYLDFTQQRFIRIDNTIQIIDPVAQTRLISPLPSEFPLKPMISTMIHCDGLVLLKLNNTELGLRRLLIWNPILGQIKWIQPMRNLDLYRRTRSYRPNWIDNYMENHTVPIGYNIETYGIGYDNVSPDHYKILRFYYRVVDLDTISGNEIEIEIYDLKSNSWKFLQDSPRWSLELSCKGVSVTGNMYWVAEGRIGRQYFIQSFNFSTETFKPKCCIPFEYVTPHAIALSSFKRDKLCLFHNLHHFGKRIEIWVSNKVNEEVLVWSRYLNVAEMPLFYADQILANPGFFIDKNGKIRVWCERGIDGSDDVSVSVYEISKDGFKEEFERSRFKAYGDYDTPFFSGYVYVPSLVPLPQ